MKQFLRTILLLALPALVAACNTDYNFDNVSLEVTVGNTDGIVIPLGSTGEITIGSLLEESGLESDEEGNYGLSFEDSMSYNFEFGTIAPISGLSPTISPVTTSLIGDINSDISTFTASKKLSLPSGVTAEMEIPANFPLLGQEFHMHYAPHTFEGEFEVEVPAEIASIKTIRFGANGEGSILDLQFDLGGMADVSDRRIIEKLNIELPAGFTIEKVAGEAVNDYTTIYAGEGSTTPNHFHIENFEMTGDHLTIDILIKSVDLSNASIASDGKLIIDEDITFDLDFTGTFKTGKVTSVAPEVNVKADLVLHDATFTTGNISHSIDVTKSISKSISVPTEIQKIDNIEFVNDATDKIADIVITLDFENSPVGRIELNDVEITLPDYLNFGINNGWSSKGGKLCKSVISIDTTTGGEIEIASFGIYGTRNLDINNGVIDLSSEVGFKGTISIPDGQEITLGVHHEDITITPSIKIPDLRIKSVQGIIDPDLSNFMQPVEIVLGDFSSSLEGLELDLNINAPVLCVEVQNPIGVGINAVINIDAYKDGQIAKSAQTPTIVIKPEATTTLAIVGQISSTPEGADGYLVEEFADIINLLPEKLVITIDAETDKRSQTITLQDNYTFNIAYWVDVPITFSHSTNGHIAYTTTIEDIDLSPLADIDATVECVTLNIASKSTLPIELALSLEMLDAEGLPIESITATTKGSIEGTANGSEEVTSSKSSLELAIDAPEGSSTFGELAKTKGIRCRLDGTTIGGGALNSNQYIDLSLSLLLPEGITVDLATLGGGTAEAE